MRSPALVSTQRPERKPAESEGTAENPGVRTEEEAQYRTSGHVWGQIILGAEGPSPAESHRMSKNKGRYSWDRPWVPEPGRVRAAVSNCAARLQAGKEVRFMSLHCGKGCGTRPIERDEGEHESTGSL